MNIKTIMGLWVGICGASGNLTAESAGNPYVAIATRNSFALRAIPIEEPLRVPVPEPVSSLEIKLTGITTLLGAPCAILEFFDPQTKRTDRPPFFREGDRYHGQIMIAAIDAEHGLVRITSDGRETTLDFVRNGIKAREVAPPVPVPPSVPAVPSMTREQAAAILERQRGIYQQQNHPALSILPPPGIGFAPAANEAVRR